MSNLSFRPRPLDVTRPIPIFRKELEDEIDISIGRTVPEMPTGMEDHEEREKHIQDLLNRTLFASAQVEIPTPIVKVVEEYDKDPNLKPFIRPQSYIRVNERTAEEMDQQIEYDMDEEDENFLTSLNTPKKIIAESKLEMLIDRFEKETSRLDAIPSLEQCDALINNSGSIDQLRPPLLQQIYSYWTEKRAKLGHPLKPPDPEDPSPYKAFRPRTEEMKKRKARKNDQSSLVKLKQLRHEMERARILLEQIEKREKLKKDRVTLLNRIFELQMQLVKEEPDKIAAFITEEEDEEEEELIEDDYLYDDFMEFSPPPPRKKRIAKPPPKKRKTYTSSSTLSDTVPLRKKPEPKEIYDIVFSDEDDSSELSENDDDDNDDEEGRGDEESPHPSELAAEIGEDMFPQTIGIIQLPNVPPFRGRVRLGADGRVMFDPKPPVKTNGIVHHLETDAECYPRYTTPPRPTLLRLQSILSMHKDPLGPSASDPEKLLKKLQSLIEKKKRHDAKISMQSATPQQDIALT